MAIVRLNATWKEYKIIQEAKRATPPVAPPRSCKEERICVGICRSQSNNTSAEIGAHTTGSFIV